VPDLSRSSNGNAAPQANRLAIGDCLMIDKHVGGILPDCGLSRRGQLFAGTKPFTYTRDCIAGEVLAKRQHKHLIDVQTDEEIVTVTIGSDGGVPGGFAKLFNRVVDSEAWSRLSDAGRAA
jgi:hypothetical protein